MSEQTNWRRGSSSSGGRGQSRPHRGGWRQRESRGRGGFAKDGWRQQGHGDGRGTATKSGVQAPKPAPRVVRNDGRRQGRCTLMCPVKERRQREEGHDVSEFEVAGVTARGKKFTNQELAVKKFARSAAGTDHGDMENVRGVETLVRTQKYLIEDVLLRQLSLRGDSTPCRSLMDGLYAFVSDRFRAIRQDFTVQHAFCKEYVSILEEQILFHCFAYNFFTVKEESKEFFEAKLCIGQMSQCFAPLLEMYETNTYNTEARRDEFIACFLLLNIDSPALGEILYKFKTAIGSKSNKALFLSSLWRQRDYCMFLKLVRSEWVDSTAMSLFLDSLICTIECIGLESMNSTYTHREPMALSTLCTIFHCDDIARLRKICTMCGLEVENEAVSFKSKSFDRTNLSQIWKINYVNNGVPSGTTEELHEFLKKLLL